MYSLHYIGDEGTRAAGGAPQEGTAVEAALETIEPYLLDKISALTHEDLRGIFVGFSHPHVPKRFGILDVIEAKLMNMCD